MPIAHPALSQNMWHDDHTARSVQDHTVDGGQHHWSHTGAHMVFALFLQGILISKDTVALQD